MKFIPRHRWDFIEEVDGITHQRCTNCGAECTIPKNKLSTSNPAQYRKIVSGGKYCTTKKLPGIDTTKVTITPNRPQLKDVVPPSKPRIEVPKPGINFPIQSAYIKPHTHEEAREFEELVMINLAYEELVKHGIRGRVRDILGRFLYSKGYEEKLKKLENG